MSTPKRSRPSLGRAAARAVRRRPPKDSPLYEQRKRAKAVLVAALKACGAQRLNRTQVYKTFYLAHVYHMRDEGALLTDWPIVRMDHGPGVESGPTLLDELVKSGALRMERGRKGPHAEFAYSIGDPKQAEKYVQGLTSEECASIAKACDLTKNKTGKALSALTHRDSRSWRRAHNGQELDVYADLLSEADDADLRARLDESAREIADVF